MKEFVNLIKKEGVLKLNTQVFEVFDIEIFKEKDSFIVSIEKENEFLDANIFFQFRLKPVKYDDDNFTGQIGFIEELKDFNESKAKSIITIDFATIKIEENKEKEILNVIIEDDNKNEIFHFSAIGSDKYEPEGFISIKEDC